LNINVKEEDNKQGNKEELNHPHRIGLQYHQNQSLTMTTLQTSFNPSTLHPSIQQFILSGLLLSLQMHSHYHNQSKDFHNQSKFQSKDFHNHSKFQAPPPPPPMVVAPPHVRSLHSILEGLGNGSIASIEEIGMEIHQHPKMIDSGKRFHDAMTKLRRDNWFHCPNCKERSFETKSSGAGDGAGAACTKCSKSRLSNGISVFSAANKGDPIPIPLPPTVREASAANWIQVGWEPMETNIGDIFTKMLDTEQRRYLLSKIFVKGG
jgi:hypothetical protein